MTPEHEEAVKLTKQFGNHFYGDPCVCAFTYSQLAALIAEVSRNVEREVAQSVARELPPELFDTYAVWKQIPESKHVSADHTALVLDSVTRLIRARLDSPSGKEERE